MVYRFGDFTLDDATRQLLSGGSEVHLSPKAYDLLAALIADRSRALSKAELMQRLRPSTFVEETNIAGLVTEIVCWDAKYAYNFWRPITAIQQGDADGNDARLATRYGRRCFRLRRIPTTCPGTRRTAARWPRH